MPKPIPPPPKQPSEEETRLAITWLRNFTVVACLLFFINAQLYQPDAFFVQYGRNSSQEWAVERIRIIEETKLRSHEQGKIIWLIGSSMMRDAFHEKQVNQDLQDRNSPYRIFKVGMNRGAPGIVAGLMSMIPFREGDKLLVNIHETHFKKEWLTFSELPSYRLMTMYSLSDFWEISEWTLADKLEQSSAIPWNFYTYHESYTKGTTRWLAALTKPKWPKKKRQSYHWTHHPMDKIKKFGRGPDSKDYFDRDGLDFSPTQFNMQGLQKIRRTLSDKIDVYWLYLPCSEIYRSEVQHEYHQEQFVTWAANQDNIIYFPQAPDDAYYDIKHANTKGRDFYHPHLLNWIQQPDFIQGTYPILQRKRTIDRRDP